jgi:hypothetical protein
MKRTFAAAVAATVVLAAAAARADSYDPVVAGARAEGMGGAAIAAAADLEAVPANPAGLLGLARAEVLFGARALEDTAVADPASGPSVTTGDHDTAVTLSGIAVPLGADGRRVVLALAYQRPLELVTHFRDRDIGGGVTAWSPAAAVALTPWLGAGIAVNAWGGTRDYDHALADGSRLAWQSDYSGYNATLGLRFDLARTKAALPVRIGLAAHTPFDLAIDYRERASSAAGVASAADWTYRVEMPWRFGVGVCWDPAADLSLALDVETRNFRGNQIIAIGDAGTTLTPLSASDDNVTPVRLGAEYRLRAGSWVVPLRAGVRSVPTLYADRRDGVAGDQATGLALSGGIGVARGRLRADVAYSRASYERETTTGDATATTTRTYGTWTLQVAVGLGSAPAR